MGAGQSVPRYCFHIFQIQKNSPAFKASLDSYFDYIIAVEHEGQNYVPEDGSIGWLIDIAKKYQDKPLVLTVYNRRYGEPREVTIVPALGWGGEGLLGCSIRFTSYNEILQDSGIFHILQIQDNSAAREAGLNAFRDYVIASPDGQIHTPEDFSKLLTGFEDRWLSLIVYNVDLEACRHVWIRPTTREGRVCLGCDIGYGYLHKIPRPLKPHPPISFPASPLPTPKRTIITTSILRNESSIPDGAKESQKVTFKMDERQFPEEVAIRQDAQIDELYMKNQSPIDLQISSAQMKDLAEKCDIQMSKVTSPEISDLFQGKHPTEMTSADFSEVHLSDAPTLPNRRPSASYYGRLLTFTEDLLSDNNPRANSQNQLSYSTIETVPLETEIRRNETITNYKCNIGEETLKAERMKLSFGNVEENIHNPFSNTQNLKNESTNEISGKQREVNSDIINNVCVDNIRHKISPPVKPIDMTEFLLENSLVDTKLDSPVSLIDNSIISSAIVELNRPLENNNFKEAIETGELTDSAFFSHNKRNNESDHATCVSYLDMPVIKVDNSLETSKKIMVEYPSPLETLLGYGNAGPNYQSTQVMNEERLRELKTRTSFEEPNTNNDTIHVTDTQVDIDFPLITPLEHRQPSNQDRQDMLRMQRRTSPDILRTLQQMNINYIEDTPLNFQSTIYPQNSNVPSIESPRKGSVDAKPVQISGTPWLLPTTAKNRLANSNTFDTTRKLDDDTSSLL